MFVGQLSMSALAYIFSISLQIAGALLLLIYSISTKREAVIRRFVGKGLLAREGERLEYNEKAYKEEFCRAYLNKFSFGYIALGYLLGVWGNSGNICAWNLTVGIILIVFLVMFITIKVVYFLVGHSKTVNKRIENKDLLELGIKPDVDCVTSEEIDQLFEKDWDSVEDSQKKT